MSNKNSKGISFGQYRVADLMIFLLIMCVCEAINVLAIRKWFEGMMFTVSVMLPVTLAVLIRWNWFAAIFPVADGILYCWLNGAGAETYLVYIVGNAFVLLSWFLFVPVYKEKWFSRWYLAVIYVIVSFVLLVAGRTLMGLCVGISFSEIFTETVLSECVSFFFTAAFFLIGRKIDGLLEDQKKYLLRVARENEPHAAEEEYWDGYTELDEEELSKLGGKGGRRNRGISLDDEYPPDSR